MFGDGFVQSQQLLGFWMKATEEQMGRLEQMSAELTKFQGQAVERAQEAVLETSRLMNETLSYSNQLANEWRKVTLEATKKAADLATPKA